MKYMLILVILLNSYVLKKNKAFNKQLDLNFNEEMTFEEFKIKLEEYSNNSPYPNINN